MSDISKINVDGIDYDIKNSVNYVTYIAENAKTSVIKNISSNVPIPDSNTVHTLIT